MRIDSIFEIIDQSDIVSLDNPTLNVNRPTFLQVASAPKGFEELMPVEGKKFFNIFGSYVNFSQHGQPLLQAAKAITAGAKLYFKRVVANDAKLAHIGVSVTVTKTQEQLKDASGNLLYIDNKTGLDTVDVSDTDGVANKPKVKNGATMKYGLHQVVNNSTNSVATISAQFLSDVTSGGTETEKTFPLFLFAETGRGVSTKKFSFTPDYQISRMTEYTKYALSITENNSVIETHTCTFNPDIVEKERNISIGHVIKNESLQLRTQVYEDQFTELVAFLSEAIGMPVNQLKYHDVLFGKTFRGVAIEGITIDASVSLGNIYGISLVGGSNGAFGDHPIRTSAYETALGEVFDGTFTNAVYDLDNIKLDMIIDADYPQSVKRKIEGLVSFRQDCVFLRDFGIGKKTIEEFKLVALAHTRNMFCADYPIYWDIIDPYSKKQITVTGTYSFVDKIVNHFVNGGSRPMAGMQFGFMFSDVIDGTENFIPIYTDKVDQKTEMQDLRFNYVTKNDGVLTLASLFTSQERYTQLSFLNNVIAIQSLIKALRTQCPKSRFSLLSGTDLKKYKDEMTKVVNKYNTIFEYLTIEFIKDSRYNANKISYAAIKVRFKDFEQTEYFKIVALPTV